MGMKWVATGGGGGGRRRKGTLSSLSGQTYLGGRRGVEHAEEVGKRSVWHLKNSCAAPNCQVVVHTISKSQILPSHVTTAI